MGDDDRTYVETLRELDEAIQDVKRQIWLAFEPALIQWSIISVVCFIALILMVYFAGLIGG